MTTFNSVCSVELDCMIAFHLADNCGSLAAVGLHRSEEKRWTTVESACRAATPLMPCPSKPTTTEDGKTGAVSQIAVTCEAGRCRTCTGCRPSPPPSSDGGAN